MIQLIYRPLLRIRLRHGFYAAGESTQDFSLLPTPATRWLLEQQGLIYRPASDGGRIFARMKPSEEPDQEPEELFASLGDDPLHLQFQLLARHPYVTNISDVPFSRPGAEVFYFNNLQSDPADGRLHLGDSIESQRLGPAIPLVRGEVLTYSFEEPVAAATIAIADMLGEELHSESFRLEDEETTSSFRIDLTRIPRMRPGNYTASDDQGGSFRFFYAPDLSPQRLFGIIEIWSSLLVGEALEEQVPEAYRFLDGDVVASLEYHVQFDPRSTTWQYTVIKKHDVESIDLAQITVSGTIPFTKQIVEGDAVFTSDAEVLLSDEPPGLDLLQGQQKLATLPYPRPATPLRGDPPDAAVSEMFVYV